jgi:RNA polymerase sigma-70 factor (ECF subfamily)
MRSTRWQVTDLGQAYEEWRTYLLGIAGKIANYDAAPDIVQSGMVKAFEHIANNPDEPINSTKGWLASIVRNVAIDYVRRSNLHDRVVGKLNAEQITEYNPSTDLNDGIDARIIVANAGLTHEEIYIIEQVYLYGRSYQELASELDLSLTTVKRRVTSARTKLRDAKEKLNA